MDRSSSSFTRRSNNVLVSPRLKLIVFPKRKGVRYHRDGQVRSCRFCEIARTKSEPFLYQDDHVVVFRPLRPVVASHVLIVPRAHIRNVNLLAAKHRGLLARMHRVAEAMMTQEFEMEDIGEQPQELEHRRDGDTDEKRVRYSFHLPPFNSIDHVHMHAFHDDMRSLTWYGRLKYRTESWWCRSYEQVMARLDEIAGGTLEESIGIYLFAM
ncbi:unnamed protein product [Peronospora farinosa]|uniref:HIT domain-containing protein n=1 Tax=Peronospora farinosa TaxID=134698 RepID=A0AAV0SRP6_9STRA|nr:unnamed protein product [Peronospora farinosa]